MSTMVINGVVPVDGALWQWDVDRKVEVPKGTVEVHSALEGGDTGWVTLPDEDLQADIPNLLLQSGKALEIYTTDGKQTRTFTRLHVNRRPKPEDYEYKVTDTASLTDLIDERLALIEYADLNGLPTIEGVTVVGDLMLSDLGVEALGDEDIQEIINNVLGNEEK